MQASRFRNKEFFWSMVGPYCRRCGFDEFVPALHLHHLNPEEKTERIDCLGLWLSSSRYKLVQKIAKTRFTIFCANCHIKLHSVLFERDVFLNPIDTKVFIEMSKCMLPPKGMTNAEFNKIDTSIGNMENGLVEVAALEDRYYEIELVREQRSREGINCELEECGFCGIERII
mgnify:CR=1 FL=1